MKKKKVTIGENEVITVANIKVMGEHIAMQALATLMKYNGFEILYDTYHKLIVDIHHANEIGYTFSDSYDIAQDAMCFLCQFIGCKLGDYYGKSAKGKDINIKTACYHALNRKIKSELGRKRKLEELDGILEYKQPFYEIPDKRVTDEDYDKVDETIEKMKLTKKQKATLICYYNGMRYMETSRYLSIGRTSLWVMRKKIQKKYLNIIK